jgi:16S rRNA (cytosine1402-N4)-methyltransferase
VLLDLGVSSPQFDQPERGFSFQHDGPLDMRMDPTSGKSAEDWLNHARQDEIRDVIATLGEERFANRVAGAIVETRQHTPFTRTSELAAVIARAVRTREPGKHPATRSFQAIRMHINDELGQLERALEQTLTILAPGGRLAVISFHSLEDRAVKNFMRKHSSVDPVLRGLPVIPESARPPLTLVGRKQRASSEEVRANPRARSALLRVAELRPAGAA